MSDDHMIPTRCELFGHVSLVPSEPRCCSACGLLWELVELEASMRDDGPPVTQHE